MARWCDDDSQCRIGFHYGGYKWLAKEVMGDAKKHYGKGRDEITYTMQVMLSTLKEYIAVILLVPQEKYYLHWFKEFCFDKKYRVSETVKNKRATLVHRLLGGTSWLTVFTIYALKMGAAHRAWLTALLHLALGEIRLQCIVMHCHYNIL